MNALVTIGTAYFSSSASALSINFDVTSNLENNSTTLGVTEITSSSEVPLDFKWYEILLTHMHDPAFWQDLLQFIQKLTPGALFGMLIQPRSEKGLSTLGPLVLVTSETTEEWLKSHFIPLLEKLEEDYNEEFKLDTKIRMKFIGQKEGSVVSSSIGASKARGRSSNSIVLEAIQTLAKSQATQTQALLEAIKAQNRTTQTNYPWMEIGKGIATAVAPFFGASINFTPSPAPTPTAQTPGEVQVTNTQPLEAQMKALQDNNSTLENRIANLETKLSSIDSKLGALLSALDSKTLI
jgi:hypothetical protein